MGEPLTCPHGQPLDGDCDACEGAVRARLATYADSPLSRLADAVCAAWEVDRAGLLGPDLGREFTRPRHALMLLLREGGRSYPLIGRMVGRDHSTVIAGVRAAARRAERDGAFRARLRAVCDAMAGRRDYDSPGSPPARPPPGKWRWADRRRRGAVQRILADPRSGSRRSPRSADRHWRSHDHDG